MIWNCNNGLDVNRMNVCIMATCTRRCILRMYFFSLVHSSVRLFQFILLRMNMNNICGIRAMMGMYLWFYRKVLSTKQIISLQILMSAIVVGGVFIAVELLLHGT